MAPSALPGNSALILGPPIVGIVLNWFFYGILVMQYFMYLNNENKDKKWLRIAVHFIFLLDTIQSIMAMDDVFFWYVYNFNDILSLFKFNIATIDGPLLDALIMFTVQLVYCWRVWVLGRWRIVPICAAFLSLVACGCGMFIGINDIIVDLATAKRLRPVEETWLLASAVTDVTIACSMGYLLMKYRKEKTSKSTMALVRRLLLLTLETNAVTAAMAIALVTVFFIPSIREPNANIYEALGYTIGKLYSNCFMVLLNQRIYYHTSETIVEGTQTSFGFANRRSTDNRNASANQNQTAGTVSVIQFSETRTDAESGGTEMGGILETKGNLKPVGSREFGGETTIV